MVVLVVRNTCMLLHLHAMHTFAKCECLMRTQYRHCGKAVLGHVQGEEVRRVRGCGIGDALAITTKEGSKSMMTAVQLNPNEINEAEDELPAQYIMSISVS